MSQKKIETALISVFHKDNLEPIVQKLNELGVRILSTGGTKDFIQNQGVEVTAVEDVTDYPSIFGGRVKTLHPKVFGGILHRRDNEADLTEKKTYEIPSIDLVIVDLYPFEDTVASGAGEQAIIEKIDIGGISLIRAAAKNFKDVWIVSSRSQYGEVLNILDQGNGETDLKTRKHFAAAAFNISSHYDTAIFNYLSEGEDIATFKASANGKKSLRYGENPHQEGAFYGDFNAFFEQLNGKEVSYNNLVDIEAAVQLISEFKDQTAFGILKHNNACGIATGNTVKEAYQRAFAADTLSAFGGVLVTNKEVTLEAAKEMHTLFFEIIIAPSFKEEALEVLKQKKNRIILVQKESWQPGVQHRTLLNGVIVQQHDWKTDELADLKEVTQKKPTSSEIQDLLFASKICKHTKSNTIILAKDNQLLASGVGQTSRVDALDQAIEKAKKFGFSLDGAVMASDAFFPFPDCVEIAHKAGVSAIIQPGGSIKDQLSIDYCDENGLAMVFTGHRHFKH